MKIKNGKNNVPCGDRTTEPEKAKHNMRRFHAPNGLITDAADISLLSRKIYVHMSHFQPCAPFTWPCDQLAKLFWICLYIGVIITFIDILLLASGV